MRTNQKWKESINEKLFFMNTMQDRPGNGIHSAKNSIKPMNFYCSARGAKIVQLSGDFNHWYPMLMEPREEAGGSSRCGCRMAITNTGFWWMASPRWICTPPAPPAMNAMNRCPSSP